MNNTRQNPAYLLEIPSYRVKFKPLVVQKRLLGSIYWDNNSFFPCAPVIDLVKPDAIKGKYCFAYYELNGSDIQCYIKFFQYSAAQMAQYNYNVANCDQLGYGFVSDPFTEDSVFIGNEQGMYMSMLHGMSVKEVIDYFDNHITADGVPDTADSYAFKLEKRSIVIGVLSDGSFNKVDLFDDVQNQKKNEVVSRSQILLDKYVTPGLLQTCALDDMVLSPQNLYTSDSNPSTLVVLEVAD